MPIFYIDTGSIANATLTGSLYGTSSWANDAISSSYSSTSSYALNAGMSNFIASGIITASVSADTNSLFLIKSGSTQYLNISSSGDTTINSNLFIIKNFTTQQPVFTVSQSVVQFATQSNAPTALNGGIWFTATDFYIGVD